MSNERKTALIVTAGVALGVIAIAGLVWAYYYFTSPAKRTERLLDEVRAEFALAAQPGTPAATTLPSYLRWLPRRRQRFSIHRFEKLTRQIVAIGPPAGPVLLTALKTEDRSVAYYAAARLADIHSDEMIDPLMGLLDGDDEKLRRLAFLALTGSSDVPRVRDRLVAWLSGADENAAFYAASLLGKKKIPEAIEAAAELVKHEDPRKRRIGAFILGYAGDCRATEALAELLASKNELPRTQWMVVNILAKIDDPAAIEALKHTAESNPADFIRRQAEKLLSDKGISIQPAR